MRLASRKLKAFGKLGASFSHESVLIDRQGEAHRGALAFLAVN
jgi:hypothetical protein